MRWCFSCHHPRASPETGTWLESKQPLSAPQLALSLAQTYSLTLRLPGLLLKLQVLVIPWDVTLGQGHALGAKPGLSLGRGHPGDMPSPAAVGKQTSKKRPGPVPTRPGVP